MNQQFDILRCILLYVLLLVFIFPVFSQVTMVDEERNVSVTVAGWMQPRYDMVLPYAGDTISRFSVRRVLLDFRGHAFSEKLTYRATPELSDLDREFARNVYPILLYINYAFSSEAQLMFGQFSVPFHWHYYVPLPGLYFYERSLASVEFGTFGGWDKGVMFHGRSTLAGAPFGYGIALIDGEGFNRRKERPTGHTLSALATWAPFGSFPVAESDVRSSEEVQLTIGLGAQYGFDSEARNWSLGRDANNRADFITGTLFTRFALRGLSLIGEGFYRNVTPETIDAYNGMAYTLAGGYMILPQKMEVIARYTGMQFDLQDDQSKAVEWGAGVNIFFHGHNAQLRIQYQGVERWKGTEYGSDGQFVVEAQIQFF